METTVKIQGRDVRVVGEDENIAESPKFRDWTRSFDADFSTETIYEEWARFSKEGELIFAVLYHQFRNGEGRERGGFCYLRSNSAATFLVLKDIASSERFVVLVEQRRPPVGRKLLEIPAGSLEDDKDFLATMVSEIDEEVQLKVRAKDLISLGEYYTSPGTTNESMRIYCCEIVMRREEIEALRDRLAGNRHHGEEITVRLVALNDFEKLGICDMKTRLAFELYRARLLSRLSKEEKTAKA